MTDALVVEIEMLSQSEIDTIWHQNKKRAGNYGVYLATMNARSVGDAWGMPIAAKAAANGFTDPDTGSDEYAKAVRYNFNEAAANRTTWVIVPADAVEADGDGHVLKADKRPVAVDKEGVYHVEEKAPVRLNWKTVSHVEKRTVTDE